MKNKANINKSTLRLPVLAIGLLLCMFIVSLLAGSKTCFAAQSENELEGITTLEKDKVYEYDLNNDGKSEKIQYKIILNDEKFTVTLKLYINDKLCMSRKDHGFSYTLQLVDLDKNDNYLDLYGYGTMESDCISYSFFARYDENNQYHAIKFSPKELTNNFNTTRYSLGALDGDGKFDLIIDTPIFSEAIGCYICYVPFQLKDNVISCVPAKTYAFNKSSKEYQYKAAKSFSVYATVGSKKVVYTVKKGDMVTFNSLYVTKSGKAYFRIVNNKGKTGWIKAAQENIFVEYPAWG
ncbi:MAG: hypothetical protein H6Q59_701 [Firmicutes bacterium]|nr:hypothetical protein [Bacillota bacterium]